MTTLPTISLALCCVVLGWVLRSRCSKSHHDAITLQDLEDMENRINMKLSGLSAVLDAVSEQAVKIAKEVQTLKDSLSDVDLPTEAQASLDRLVAQVQAIDDLNTDA